LTGAVPPQPREADSILLRAATEEDAALLLEWRNDPVTRRWAFTEAAVAPDEHAAWLARKLADPRCLLWIAERDGVPVGQVRLDQDPDGDAAEISIALAPEFRGRGYAPLVLSRMVGEARDRLSVSRLRALVKPGNEASVRSFERVGFERCDPTGDGALRFELELSHDV
jgi:RimJ/RimL family protein N-acetyltransferase